MRDERTPTDVCGEAIPGAVLKVKFKISSYILTSTAYPRTLHETLRKMKFELIKFTKFALVACDLTYGMTSCFSPAFVIHCCHLIMGPFQCKPL